MIPIHDLRGNNIGFGGRIYQTNDSSKYINAKATKIFDKKSILYNYHRAHNKLGKNDSIIIMEGYFDVIRASTIGINNCVAPMGTALTKQHIQILKKITNNLILCFDGDKAGEEATIKALELLEKENLNIKIVRLEEKDPDEFIIKRGEDEFRKKIANPLSVIEFKMQYLKEDKNLNNTKEVSIYLDQIIKELSKEKDSFLVELTLKKLEQKFNIAYDNLLERYKQYKTKIPPKPEYAKLVNNKPQNPPISVYYESSPAKYEIAGYVGNGKVDTYSYTVQCLTRYCTKCHSPGKHNLTSLVHTVKHGAQLS